jgi:IS5 family transposase
VRKIVDAQPCFFLNLFKEGKIVTRFRDKYNKIDALLENNAEILNTFHSDLSNYCSSEERETNFSSEHIFRMIIVKRIEGLPYRKCIIRIADSDFLRNFTRFGMSKVLSYGLLCAAVKMITPATWEKINFLLTRSAEKENKISGDYMRLDSTVSETNIHFPTDNGLLWDSYRVISRIIRTINKEEPSYNIGNRFHDKKIKKLYTFIATHSSGKKNNIKRKIKRFMKILIERVENICDTTRVYLDHANRVNGTSVAAKSLLLELERLLPLVIHVVSQAYRSQVLGEKVPASERIFSIFEEHTELLMRGKSGTPVEFGHLVTLGQTKEKFISFYDVQEKSLHDTEMKDIALKSHKEQFGSYPKKFTADKNYWVGAEDIKNWEKDIDLCAIAKKGRRNQAEYDREHSDDFKLMQRFRAGIEGSISVLKRVFGLDICRNRGFKSFASSVGCLVFCHNLVLLANL